MPNKTEEYLALACKTADSFSRQWEHWAEFLITAARLYKYSYPDQLMIYAQRPDATACAEYDVWNNKMNRYVRRGSKGIALLDESGGYPRLHYVFDVSDTAPRRNALYPDLWQINDSLKEPVRSMLAENYGVHSESFGQQLADVAGKLVQSYWDNNSSDIKQKRNILTCQFAVENHLSLGKIDKVKKKPVPILTLRKEYGIVIKHRINFHLSA